MAYVRKERKDIDVRKKQRSDLDSKLVSLEKRLDQYLKPSLQVSCRQCHDIAVYLSSKDFQSSFANGGTPYHITF